jgi:hypothetical protein
MPDRVNGKKLWEAQGSLDFVAAWYAKAAAFMKGKSQMAAAFVSTNSIVQGEQVAPLWHPLMTHYHLRITFAWKTFRWFNKADEMAHVHCVIVGFCLGSRKGSGHSQLFEEDRPPIEASHINAYLMNAENRFVWNRGTPLCDVPSMGIGNKPIDDGNYLFTEQEKNQFIAKEPASESYFRPWYGADEFINRRPRYCLWLGNCTATELNAMPQCKKRVQAVMEYRSKSRSPQTRELALTPRRFHVENMPQGNYIIVPSTSSERRRYVPMGFMEPLVMSSNGVLLIPDASLYHFGVLESRIHMAWMRIVCGRLEMRYRYSAGIVYNNFPWPDVTEEQKTAIEQAANSILEARALEPEATLAALYDPVSMPVPLMKAHQENDRIVADAFQIDLHLTDEEIALELMQRSERIAAKKDKKKVKRTNK